MAAYKVINRRGKYHDDQTYTDLVSYVKNPEKVRSGGVIGAAVIPEIAAESMEAVTKAYHKEAGLKLRHTILSFDAQEHVDFETAAEIARQEMEFYADDFQMLAAIHENTDHIHIHFLMNTVNYCTGQKYHGKKKDYYGNLKHLNTITKQYGIHTTPVKDSDWF